MVAGGDGTLRDLVRCTATQRVGQNDERVVRESHHPGDIAGRDLKRFGAKNHRPFSGLLEGDAVMQTARRATASVAGCGDEIVALRREIGQQLPRCRRRGVVLGGQWVEPCHRSAPANARRFRVSSLSPLSLWFHNRPMVRPSRLSSAGARTDSPSLAGTVGVNESHAFLLLLNNRCRRQWLRFA